MKLTYYKIAFISFVLYAPMFYLLEDYPTNATGLEVVFATGLFMFFFFWLKRAFVYDEKIQVKGNYVFKNLQQFGRLKPGIIFIAFLFYFTLNIILVVSIVSETFTTHFAINFDSYAFLTIIEIVLILFYFIKYNKEIVNNKLIGKLFFGSIFLIILFFLQSTPTNVISPYIQSPIYLQTSETWKIFTILIFGFANYVFVVAVIEQDEQNYKLFLANRMVYLFVMVILSVYVFQQLLPIKMISSRIFLTLFIGVGQIYVYSFLIKKFFEMGHTLKLFRAIDTHEQEKATLFTIIIILGICILTKTNGSELIYISRLLTAAILYYLLFIKFGNSKHKVYRSLGVLAITVALINLDEVDTVNILAWTFILLSAIYWYWKTYILEDYELEKIKSNSVLIFDDNDDVLYFNHIDEEYSTYTSLPSFDEVIDTIQTYVAKLNLNVVEYMVDDTTESFSKDNTAIIEMRNICLRVKGVKPKVTITNEYNYYWFNARQRLNIKAGKYEKTILHNQKKIG